jgi:hypothetical protein
VVGIHKGGTQNFRKSGFPANIGRLITEDLLSELRMRASELKAASFTPFEPFHLAKGPIANRETFKWVRMKSRSWSVFEHPYTVH